MKITRFIGFIRLLVVLSFSLAAFSTLGQAKQAPLALSAPQQQAIRKLNDYLNSFQTLKADFVQVSSKGTMTQGQMLISKPGRLRFEYAPPNPLLIVSDGRWLTIKDKVKEKGDQFPLSSTPLRLVVAPQIDLLAETDIIGFDSTDGLTSVSFVDRKGTLGGYITLVFDEKRNQLVQWIIVDGKDRHTTVQLTNLVTGGTFDPKLFISKIDRGTP